MILSNGVAVKSPTVLWEGSPGTWGNWTTSLFRSYSYAEIYRRQLWVNIMVSKLGNAVARLPLKTYERTPDGGRQVVKDHPYAVLMAQPNPSMDSYLFWLWVESTTELYGEAFLAKVRDPGGRPVRLIPMHPLAVIDEVRDGKVQWSYNDGSNTVGTIARRDLVHFRNYNPDSPLRGLSKLEPLRSSLESDEGAQAATAAMWRNGAKPSIILKHPKTVSDGALRRLADDWSEIHGGVDNWSKAAVLEEGIEPVVLNINYEQLQYVESRKLHREEVAAAYDVPPPVAHILDHATFSNITEQMRSMYRDTMAPKLGLIESTLEFELRDGRFGEDRDPDFGDEVYARFLLDEVLRGDFEVRSNAYAQAINNGWMTPAEVRRLEDLPFVEGSDRLLINAALVPVDQVGVAPAAPAPVPAPEAPAEEGLEPDTVRALMGKLSRAKAITDVEPNRLLSGEAPKTIALVSHALADAVLAGDDLDGFKGRLRALVED